MSGTASRPPAAASAGAAALAGAERVDGAVAAPVEAGRAASGDAALEVPKDVVVRPGTERLWVALKEVLDPEYPVSVVDLGLVYDIRRTAGAVEVDLTFTATACPCMAFIHEDVRERLGREPDVDAVEIRVVWDPPWTRERMTESARELLRRFGVAA